MQSARSSTSVVKVSFQGETKRLNAVADYSELVRRTRESFGNQLPQDEFKYYYCDRDFDLISVSSQADLAEAIEGEPTLKLTVASTQQDAWDQIDRASSSRVSQPSGPADIERHFIDAQSNFSVIEDDQKVPAETSAPIQEPLETEQAQAEELKIEEAPAEVLPKAEVVPLSEPEKEMIQDALAIGHDQSYA